MGFGKKSKAGRFGTIMLFVVLEKKFLCMHCKKAA
jgi:hypothetical protein